MGIVRGSTLSHERGVTNFRALIRTHLQEIHRSVHLWEAKPEILHSLNACTPRRCIHLTAFHGISRTLLLFSCLLLCFFCILRSHRVWCLLPIHLPRSLLGELSQRMKAKNPVQYKIALLLVTIFSPGARPRRLSGEMKGAIFWRPRLARPPPGEGGRGQTVSGLANYANNMQARYCTARRKPQRERARRRRGVSTRAGCLAPFSARSAINYCTQHRATTHSEMKRHCSLHWAVQ